MAPSDQLDQGIQFEWAASSRSIQAQSRDSWEFSVNPLTETEDRWAVGGDHDRSSVVPSSLWGSGEDVVLCLGLVCSKL